MQNMMTTGDELQPLLPAELEKEIFEVSALSDLRLIPNLVLVSKRVKIWLEPLLYRCLSISHEDFRNRHSEIVRMSSYEFVQILDTKTASFLRDHVHHLALTSLSDAAVECALSSCTGIRSLAIFQVEPNPTFLPLIQAVPLVRLSINIGQLCDPGTHFEPSTFLHLTHFEIFGTDARPSVCWAGDLSLLPALTHLLIYPSPEGIHKSTFRAILALCKSLEVLVRLVGDEQDVANYTDFGDDFRAVTLLTGKFLRNWEKGVLRGEDYWFLADAFVHGRRTGRIPASNYAIPPN
ncbi:hypothetical protein MSAN_01093100 [Mycena sanguinolenta]|uniref:Uncharacterized protein n=1 Tax=Mycena sanguinolenta TaxID=230812 RepID=A0A8H7D6Q3_9AGAR|nr:hypothetical protein MSAN_01093100 [Mycena sanguinolenta]